MTIITLKDIETGQKFRVKSVAEPAYNGLAQDQAEFVQTTRWFYEETGDDVLLEFHDILNQPQLYRFIGRQHIIDGIEI